MMKQMLLGGNSRDQVFMDAAMGNRHGMISGATGTGKTVTLQVLAEAYSRLGVPVIMADIKGDLSGIAKPGKPHDKIDQRVQTIGITNFQFRSNPVLFWDVFGRNGHPLRTTISEMGPLLLAHLLELNEAQSGILYSCFRIADDQGMLLLDLKDIRALLNWMADHSRELRSDYGHIAPVSIGAIQRRLLVLEEQGASEFFAEPAIQLEDFCHSDFNGDGVINILDATELTQKAPRLYAAVLLWLMSELFESLPEVGDLEQPKLVIFFDEAHLLFDQAPKTLLDKIEQIVRLIRSKGVGVYFISQSPLDVPDAILGQLGLKIQHALRAYTPKDRKVIGAVAETFRDNPALDTEEAIQELKTGEALVSVLQKDGSPMPVQRILLRPPESHIGPLSEVERSELIQRSPFRGRYEQVVDRESAYEMLKQKAEQMTLNREEQTADKYDRRQRSSRQSIGEALVKSAARSIGSQLGRQLIRGLLGSLLGGRR